MYRLHSSKHPSNEGPKPLAEGKRSLLGLSSTRQVIVTSKQVVAVLEEETTTAEAEETGKGSRTSEIHLDLRESHTGITISRRDSIIPINTLSTTGIHRQMICPRVFIV